MVRSAGRDVRSCSAPVGRGVASWCLFAWAPSVCRSVPRCAGLAPWSLGMVGSPAFVGSLVAIVFAAVTLAVAWERFVTARVYYDLPIAYVVRC